MKIDTIDEENAMFLTLRQTIYENLIVKGSPVKEEDLTLDDLCRLVKFVGEDYARQSLTGRPLTADLAELEAYASARRRE